MCIKHFLTRLDKTARLCLKGVIQPFIFRIGHNIRSWRPDSRHACQADLARFILPNTVLFIVVVQDIAQLSHSSELNNAAIPCTAATRSTMFAITNQPETNVNFEEGALTPSKSYLAGMLGVIPYNLILVAYPTNRPSIFKCLIYKRIRFMLPYRR